MPGRCLAAGTLLLLHGLLQSCTLTALSSFLAVSSLLCATATPCILTEWLAAALLQALRYCLTFAPRCMLSTSVEFIVYKSTGGRWRFEVQLQVRWLARHQAVHVGVMGTTHHNYTATGGPTCVSQACMHDMKVCQRAGVKGVGARMQQQLVSMCTQVVRAGRACFPLLQQNNRSTTGRF